MPKNENVISYKKLKKYFKINPFIEECKKYLESHYKLYEGAFTSYQQFKDILSDLLNKLSLSRDTKKRPPDEKYHQRGILGNIKKLKNIIIKIINRVISIVTSIGFQPVFFLIGLFTTQSVVTALIASSIYWLICLAIKASTAKKMNTNKWYEPFNFLKVASEGSIVKYLQSMKETVSSTIKDIFNWFFINIENEKTEVKFNRRMLLLTLIIFILLYIIW